MAGIKWYSDTLTPGLAFYAVRTEHQIEQVMEDLALRCEEYMKENAPWEDRTGEARDGLTASVNKGALTWTLTLYHTADYGIWLEVLRNGELAIIIPTLEHMGPEVMKALSKIGSPI